jgi:arabinose-5-phosphate isomerase
MDRERIIKKAKEVIGLEIKGLQGLFDSINEDFLKAIELLMSCEGKIIVTGVGKSGIIAKKIASTLTSTGTPALYLHPSESLHGDIGVVDQKDIVIAISKSGRTDEIAMIISFLKRRNIPIIAITSNRNSELARESDISVIIQVEKEACPFDLAPTVSTTTVLALGDAIAIILMDLKRFKADDFAALHPGGDIGKKFWLKVKDMMLTGEKNVPIVKHDAPMKDVILEMTTKRGITSVVDDKGKLIGVITDGDLRRLLERTDRVFSLTAKDAMTTNPKVIDQDSLAVIAAKKMENYGITALIVIDDEEKPIGIIHLHDLMRERVI